MTPDHAVRELTVSRPRLRKDLKFAFQDYRGRPSYILEDLTHRRYFQIGLPEYQFLQNLDGNRTAREVLSQNAREFGDRALSEEEATILLRWLIDQRLLESDNADQSGRRYDHTAEQADKKPKQAMQKLFFIRIPMGNPDALLTKLTPWLAWTGTLPFVIAWFALIGYAGFLLIQNWTPFVSASASVILPGTNWLILGGIFVFLKLVHEIWHGVLAKKFGGVIPEWGIQLLVFVTPLTYVDASASWRFPSRWHRIYVASAGMFIELLLAALAVIIWVRTEPGVINTIAHNTIFAASTITLLFNANPLMRFDGYYILSDLLRIPNLATKGQQFMQWFWRKTLYSIKDLPPPPAFKEQPVAIGLYGVLSFIWRWVIWIGIMAMASVLFKGAGVLLVGIAVIGMVFGGLFKSLKFLFKGENGRRPNLMGSLGKMGLIGAGLFAIGYFVPIDPAPKAAAVIEYHDKVVLRAECAGFVREVFCENGEVVEEGQVLARLENPAKETELKQLRIDIQHSILRGRQYFDEERLAAWQAENENLKALQERLESTQALIDSLSVKAPKAGKVFGERLDSLVGRYLHPGSSIMAVIPQTAPRVLITVKQENADSVKGKNGEAVILRLRGHEKVIKATLERAELQGTTAVPHPALASTGGGPLLVRNRARFDSAREQGLAYQRGGMSEELSHFAGIGEDQARAAQQELTKTHFAAYAVLDVPDVAEQLNEGEWGYVKLANVRERRLGVWLFEKVAVYVNRRLETVKGV
tara:strand:- start:10614 stop:12881 length:2268 start_codon:yes stop_codon:yes gene_type:complete